MSPATSSLVSSCPTRCVVNDSRTPTTATTVTVSSAANLSRVAMYMMSFSMDDRHGRRPHRIQGIEVDVVQVVRHLRPSYQLVPDCPSRFIFQGKYQGLVEDHVEAVRRPGPFQRACVHA